MLNYADLILSFDNVQQYAVKSITPLAAYWLPLIPIVIFFISYINRRCAETRPKGCRKLGLPHNKTNLHDEYDRKYRQGVPEKHTDEKGHPSWRVKALFAYPIKSCAGIELDTADVVLTGLAYDRQFCFAEYITPKPNAGNASSQQPHWTARTLRDGELCKMALIRPEVWVPDPTANDYSAELDEVESQGVIVIYYPRVAGTGFCSFIVRMGMTLGLMSKELSFRIPIIPPKNTISTYPSTPVKIWKDSPVAYDYGQHLPASLRRFLDPKGKRGPLTLFKVNPAHHREILRNAPRKQDIGFQTVTGFADAYPLHLLNLASVQEVASKCKTDIPELSIRRFRANIIVQGPAAFEEDQWKRIRVCSSDGEDESVEIYASCRTIRCRLPNVDPDTGFRHPAEPDRTLKRYRRVDPGDLTNAALGLQLVPAVQGMGFFFPLGFWCG
jgi:uncharacterized protein YcbX